MAPSKAHSERPDPALAVRILTDAFAPEAEYYCAGRFIPVVAGKIAMFMSPELLSATRREFPALLIVIVTCEGVIG